MPKKAVLDTNVWVSYFINARADYLIQWIIEHAEVAFYTSTPLVEELEEVLARPKFKHSFLIRLVILLICIYRFVS